MEYTHKLTIFCVLLLLGNIMFWGVIQVVTYISSSFLLIAEYYSIL